MTNKLSLSHYLTGFILWLCLHQTALAWTLHGAAVHPQYNRPFIVAGLETQSDKFNAGTLLNNEIPFRLTLAADADKVSARRLRQALIEGLTINHDAGQLKPFSKDIGQLSKALSFKLMRGDRLTIEHTPGNGTLIKVNQQQLTQSTTDLGPLILNGLVGDVPLSSGFQKALLSGNGSKTEAAQAFAALTPAPNRASITLNASAPKSTSPVAINTELAVKLEKPTLSQPTVEKPQITASIPAPATTPKAKAETKSETKPIAPEQNQPTIEKPAAVIASNDVEPAPQPSQTTETTPVTEPITAPTATSITATTTEVATEETVAAPDTVSDTATLTTAAENSAAVDDYDEFSDEMLALKQDYYRQLVREVKTYQTIPPQAFQRGWKDELRIQITINRQGKVIETVFLEESKYKLFNEQAIKAVSRAEPLSSMPEALRGDSYTFSLPLYYKMGI